MIASWVLFFRRSPPKQSSYSSLNLSWLLGRDVTLSDILGNIAELATDTVQSETVKNPFKHCIGFITFYSSRLDSSGLNLSSPKTTRAAAYFQECEHHSGAGWVGRGKWAGSGWLDT